MSSAYVYQAALLCEDCGHDVRVQLKREGTSDNGDSDTFPQGPYPDGGGESDCPQHCDACKEFLDNPLTTDGHNYVCECVIEYLADGHGTREVLTTWIDAYGIDLSDLMDFVK